MLGPGPKDSYIRMFSLYQIFIWLSCVLGYWFTYFFIFYWKLYIKAISSPIVPIYIFRVSEYLIYPSMYFILLLSLRIRVKR